MNKRTMTKATAIAGFSLLWIGSAGRAGEILTDNLRVSNEANILGALTVEKGSVPTNKLVLYYHFNADESGVVTDQSPAGNHGTVSGAVWTTGGYVEGAYDFNGTNQWISVPAASSLNLTTAITMSAWVKFKGEGTGNHAFVMKHTTSWLQYALMRMSAPNHRFNASFSSAQNQHADYLSQQVLNDGVWYFLAATFSTASGSVKLYVDGLLDNTISKATAIYGDAIGNVEIGREHKWNEYANAIVDEVRIYAAELSSGEIKSLYNNSVSNYTDRVLLQVSGGVTDIDYLLPKGDLEMGAYTNTP